MEKSRFDIWFQEFLCLNRLPRQKNAKAPTEIIAQVLDLSERQIKKVV
jgi:hypothetical protein